MCFCPCNQKHGESVGSFKASGGEEKQVLVSRLQGVDTRGQNQIVIRDHDRTGKKFGIHFRTEDTNNTGSSIEAKVNGHSIEWCHQNDNDESKAALEEAFWLRAIQFAHRNRWERVTVVSKDSGLEEIVSIEEKAKFAFTEFAGLLPFKNWVKESPEMWQVCLQLANAYWTRSQIEVLVSEPFREHTIKLMAGHHKPTYPSFPDELLNVEYLGFWDLAGCLGHWSAEAGADGACFEIKQDRKPRFAKHVLRASMSRRLEGTVLSK